MSIRKTLLVLAIALGASSSFAKVRASGSDVESKSNLFGNSQHALTGQKDPCPYSDQKNAMQIVKKKNERTNIAGKPNEGVY